MTPPPGLTSQDGEPKRSPQPPTTRSHGIVRGHAVIAIKLFRERIADPWTLDTPAQEVHLSRSQLVRSFDWASPRNVDTSP
jgi:AraC-like DNA-binding protein